jgi:myo-inositol-1(or 4)-monophosphatase
MTELERVARAAVAEGGALLRATWRGRKTVRYKGAVDLVTETDHEVENLIVARLRQAFPTHRIIAEEAAAGGTVERARPEENVWYLDPIDGTTNFAHAYPQFAISLAFAHGDDCRFAIVLDPVRDETFTAERGGGTCLNGEPVRVSTTPELGEALVATGFPYDRRAHLDFYLGFFSDFVQRTQGVRRNGSAALDLCYVACGRLDAFWEWKLKPWDTAAGALIVREAGGTVSDFRGGPFDPHGEQTLASNGLLHAAMTRTLAARLELEGDHDRH